MMNRFYLLQEQEFFILFAAHMVAQKRKIKHRWWVHNIIKRRQQQGAYHNLVRELQLDGERFQQYFRLTREQFAQVLHFVEEDLEKRE